MTTAIPIPNSLAKLFFGAMASVSVLALAGSHPAMAQGRAVALTGTVSSVQEGKMEGVVVSAKHPGSTMMVSVSTNAQGQYSFPADRLSPGTYDITMRAVGYTLKPTTATIKAGAATQVAASVFFRPRASRSMRCASPSRQTPSCAMGVA